MRKRATNARDAKARATNARDAKARATNARDAKARATNARDAKARATNARDAKARATNARDAKARATNARDAKVDGVANSSTHQLIPKRATHWASATTPKRWLTRECNERGAWPNAHGIGQSDYNQ
jgi:pilus assembly protein FimV